MIRQLILLAFIFLATVGACLQNGPGQRAFLDSGAVEITAFPFTMGAYVKHQMTAGEFGAVVALTNNTTSAYYAIGQVYNSGYYIITRNGTEYFVFDGDPLSVSQDTEPDTIIGVFNSSTDKDLYVNGNFSATITNSSTFNTGSIDVCFFEYCRNGPVVGSFQGVAYHMWICGRALSDAEITAYHNNREDKDFIQEICLAVPDTYFVHYGCTDEKNVSIYKAGIKESKENGDTIYDEGPLGRHLAISNPNVPTPNYDDAYYISGTLEMQSSF